MIRGFLELFILGPDIICNQLIEKISNMSSGRLIMLWSLATISLL